MAKEAESYGILGKRTPIGWIVSTVFLAALAVTALFPFFYMVSISLMKTFEMFEIPVRLWPRVPQFSNYIHALTAYPFGRFFLNSSIESIGVLCGRLLIASLAGYGFSRMKFPGRNQLFLLMIATMMIPATITLVPAYIMLTSLHWVDTYLALTVPLLNYPWGVFFIRQYMMTLPENLEEAARIDGANEFAIFSKVFLPLSKPVLLVVGLLSFAGTWTSLLWELIVTRSLMMRTVSVGVSMFIYQYGADYTFQMAAATVATIPVLLVFFFGQRYFMKGITLAGVFK